MLRTIVSADRRIMHRVNQWTPPLWVRRWMMASSHAGDGWGWLLLGFGLLMWGGQQSFAALTAGLISVSAGQMVFNILKRAAGRTRPCSIDTNCWATLPPPDRYSFPSGHTITAFCVAVPIGLFYSPVVLLILIFCAMSVASSRILLGLHYLSDVAAGIVIGCGLGIVAFGFVATRL